MELIRVRSERRDDLEAINTIHEMSFPTTVEAQIVNQLRQSGHLSVSLVAELTGTVVGHIAFSPVNTVHGDVGAGLGPLAVWDPYRRQGVGAQLVNEGLAACTRTGFGWAVVLGEPNYYSRFGFRSGKAFGLHDEFGGGDAFQVIELVAGALPSGAGRVQYSPEFYDAK